MLATPRTIDWQEAIIPYTQTQGVPSTKNHGAENISWESLGYGLKMAFDPSLSKVLIELDRFEDLDVDDLRRTVRGLIMDVNGTLTGDDGFFSPEVIEKLREIRAKLPACIYCKDDRNWAVFEQLSIPVAKHLPDKPDPRGFNVALQLHLQRLHHGKLIRAEEVAMVGDNYLTDGGCKQIGMQFIHVKHRGGPEKKLGHFARVMGKGIAALHRQMEKIRLKCLPGNTGRTEEDPVPHPLVKALYEKRPPSKPL